MRGCVLAFSSETVHENAEFKGCQHAALVASKVYYYLGEFDDSLNFALGAGSITDLLQKSEYVNTIVLAKCIDKYILQRIQDPEDRQNAKPMDPNLKDVAK
ncbi:26S proteasome non-ATPase regulatory subunit 1 [Podila humilis]|nr:26S proteasome non-ATPase regulatory subunit 1 [Podila humilis]